MNVQTDSGVVTFTVASGQSVAKYTLVKLSAAGTVQNTGAGEDPIGVAQRAASAGEQVPVKLWNAGGTFLVTAAGAVTAAAAVYAAASGKVDDTVSGNVIGKANEAATAANDLIEIIAATPADQFARQSHIADAAQTQTTLTDSTGGAASTTLSAISAQTQATQTDSTGGAASSVLSAATATYSATIVNNNFASLAARLAQVKVDVAAVRTGTHNGLASVAAELALVKTDVGSLVSKLNTLLAACEANGILATS